MELQFEKREIPCLAPVLHRVQNLELTQEVRLPEEGTEASRILGCRGQVLIRSKEWNRDRIQVAGGVMLWVLYEPDSNSPVQTVEAWIPFKMDWDIPGDHPEGSVRILSRLRYGDARQVGAGKLLLRAGIGVLAECVSPKQALVYGPKDVPQDLELLTRRWPLHLWKEAGEKPFELEEELRLPPSLPGMDRLISAQMDPSVTDKKVLSDRIVFRGNANLHILYQGEDGKIHSHDFELPFSQYADLHQSHSGDARADVRMAVTRLEPELGPEGALRLKAGMTGQYLIDDRETVETMEDAYSLRRDLEISRGEADLPSILDNRRENIYGEVMIPVHSGEIAETVFWPDFPRQQRRGDAAVLEQPGAVQMLYYDEEGQLQAANHKWEGELSFPADDTVAVDALPGMPQLQLTAGSAGVNVSVQIPVQMMSVTDQGLPMVTGVKVGENRTLSPDRPSLILRRAGEDSLWDIARKSGSTMEAIRRANGLESDPVPGQMLLIPVV